ncbi:MAG: alpha/beta hydrolase-fold protein [Thermoguttaceae bacterium]
MRKRYRLLAILLAMLVVVWADRARAMDEDAAVALGRRYLAAATSAERQKLAVQLDSYQGGIEPVLRRLAQREYSAVEAGFRPAEHFSTRELRRKHPDDLLCFVVPKSYRPEQPTGLIVFLHGGGNRTSRYAPEATLQFAGAGLSAENKPSGEMLAATGMITVGPSAPWNESSYYRWCLRQSDEYLADVILECKERFNIDPDRVILLGHSMGGFGAYHHVLRQPDRFAAVVAHSGSWSLGYWPAIRGTPLCIIQGIDDARPGVRWHYTDIEYGRWTDKILKAKGLDHVYMEREGNHGFGYGRPQIAEYLEAARKLRRDPYYPRIALASPQGFGRSHCSPMADSRWLTLNESRRGEIDYDELVCHSPGGFDRWRLEHCVERRRGASIEAVNRGDNTIELTMRNVARLTVWLHPRMIDPSKPVVVRADGKTLYRGRVKPSLVTALDSYLRRRDWGLVYSMKLELRTPVAERGEEDGETQARAAGLLKGNNIDACCVVK